jgi:hypothetical protein
MVPQRTSAVLRPVRTRGRVVLVWVPVAEGVRLRMAVGTDEPEVLQAVVAVVAVDVVHLNAKWFPVPFGKLATERALILESVQEHGLADPVPVEFVGVDGKGAWGDHSLAPMTLRWISQLVPDEVGRIQAELSDLPPRQIARHPTLCGELRVGGTPGNQRLEERLVGVLWTSSRPRTPRVVRWRKVRGREFVFALQSPDIRD